MKVLRRAALEGLTERSHQHQFNSNAIRLTRTLGEPAGLKRMGVHLVRLAPGRDSTQFHHHDADEEWIYVLKGSGSARIGETTRTVSAGDFMGFATPGPAHALTNSTGEDLIYLMGGERNAADVVHYPDIRRSMIKSWGRRYWVDWQHLNEL